MVNQMFKKQIGKTIKVYIDDMLGKSQKNRYYLMHLEETFVVLRKYNMKLNPQKWVGVWEVFAFSHV